MPLSMSDDGMTTGLLTVLSNKCLNAKLLQVAQPMPIVYANLAASSFYPNATVTVCLVIDPDVFIFEKPD